jgi:hypothetical protein
MIVRSNAVNRSFIVHHDSLVPPACGFQRVRITDRSHWPENTTGGVCNVRDSTQMLPSSPSNHPPPIQPVPSAQTGRVKFDRQLCNAMRAALRENGPFLTLRCRMRDGAPICAGR